MEIFFPLLTENTINTLRYVKTMWGLKSEPGKKLYPIIFLPNDRELENMFPPFNGDVQAFVPIKEIRNFPSKKSKYTN